MFPADDEQELLDLTFSQQQMDCAAFSRQLSLENRASAEKIQEEVGLNDL